MHFGTTHVKLVDRPLAVVAADRLCMLRRYVLLRPGSEGGGERPSEGVCGWCMGARHERTDRRTVGGEQGLKVQVSGYRRLWLEPLMEPE